MGISSPWITSNSRSAKNTVAICRSVAPATPPDRAETAASMGSSALEKVFICSMAAAPEPIRESRLPAVRVAIASVPAMVRNRGEAPAVF